MTDSSPPPLPPKVRLRAALRNLLFIGLLAGVIGYAISQLWKPETVPSVSIPNDGAEVIARQVDQAIQAEWTKENLSPVGKADELTIMRRLGLALTGSVPSLEEIRQFESQNETERIKWWVARLLDDRRTSAYLAERFARAYVGVENGPFLVFRRHRMVRWLDDQIHSNRSYDKLVREMIAADGIWTTHPGANFITVTIDQNNDKEGPDQVKLASRTARAFLGVRIDCMQCHDDMFGDRWKQKDFHQLAAFFAPAKVGVTGVQDDENNKDLIHKVRYRGDKDESPVSAAVPFRPDLLPKSGQLRDRLAEWTTHPENGAFARASVNRVWAILFNLSMTEVVDDIPLDGPYPAGMEILAEDFTESGYDLQRLIRIIAATEAFQMASESANPETNPVTGRHEETWAAFPLTRLRPEQMAGSVIQAANLAALDADAHIIKRIQRWAETNEFVKRYGDLGENEFGEQPGTIPQRLLMMNGKLVKERTDVNPLMSAATRIATLSRDDSKAVDSAFLTVLSRRPTTKEHDHFVKSLSGKKGDKRSRAMTDLYWALLNSTEFSWNY
ncbi:MAG: DUF1549 domain-containing protein [Verrucomicrobiales bacterium]|nr:DUF1549 domain-containing protein [Verrucomicrobiales bacterium]